MSQQQQHIESSILEVLTLPCNRGRHDGCGGRVVHGLGILARAHGCICSCHEVATDVALDSAMRAGHPVAHHRRLQAVAPTIA